MLWSTEIVHLFGILKNLKRLMLLGGKRYECVAGFRAVLTGRLEWRPSRSTNHCFLDQWSGNFYLCLRLEVGKFHCYFTIHNKYIDFFQYSGWCSYSIVFSLTYKTSEVIIFMTFQLQLNKFKCCFFFKNIATYPCWLVLVLTKWVWKKIKGRKNCQLIEVSGFCVINSYPIIHFSGISGMYQFHYTF